MKYTMIPPQQVPAEALQGHTLPDACVVSAALEGDEVVGVGCGFMVLHAEPWWVRSDYRKHPRIIPNIWSNLQSLLKDVGAKQAVSVVLDDNPDTIRLAKWIGAEKLPGSVYMLNLEKPCLRQ